MMPLELDILNQGPPELIKIITLPTEVLQDPVVFQEVNQSNRITVAQGHPLQILGEDHPLPAEEIDLENSESWIENLRNSISSFIYSWLLDV